MATYKVTLTLELNEDAKQPEWIIPSIEDQLEEGESLPVYSIELVAE
jgi:hypothetical protein